MVVWQHMDRSTTKWVNFPPDMCKSVEAAFHASQNPFVTLDGETFQIDFATKRMVHEVDITKTQQVRRINKTAKQIEREREARLGIPPTTHIPCSRSASATQPRNPSPPPAPAPVQQTVKLSGPPRVAYLSKKRPQQSNLKEPRPTSPPPASQRRRGSSPATSSRGIRERPSAEPEAAEVTPRPASAVPTSDWSTPLTAPSFPSPPHTYSPDFDPRTGAGSIPPATHLLPAPEAAYPSTSAPPTASSSPRFDAGVPGFDLGAGKRPVTLGSAIAGAFQPGSPGREEPPTFAEIMSRHPVKEAEMNLPPSPPPRDISAQSFVAPNLSDISAGSSLPPPPGPQPGSLSSYTLPSNAYPLGPPPAPALAPGPNQPPYPPYAPGPPATALQPPAQPHHQPQETTEDAVDRQRAAQLRHVRRQQKAQKQQEQQRNARPLPKQPSRARSATHLGPGPSATPANPNPKGADPPGDGSRKGRGASPGPGASGRRSSTPKGTRSTTPHSSSARAPRGSDSARVPVADPTPEDPYATITKDSSSLAILRQPFSPERWLHWLQQFQLKGDYASLKKMRFIILQTTYAAIQDMCYTRENGEVVEIPVVDPLRATQGRMPFALDLPPKPEGPPGQLIIYRADPLDVALHLQSQGLKTAVVNPAHAHIPGSAYINGAPGLEESFFRRSNLSEYLDSVEGYSLYPIRDRECIVSTGVRVIRGNEWEGYPFLPKPECMDFISCPPTFRPKLVAGPAGSGSPTNSSPRGPLRMMPQEAESTYAKFDGLLNLGAHRGYECLVLPAFGCGNDANPPEHIAELLSQAIAAGSHLQRYKAIVVALNISLAAAHAADPQVAAAFERHFGPAIPLPKGK